MVESSSAPLFGVFVYRNGFTISLPGRLSQKTISALTPSLRRNRSVFLIGTPRATFAPNRSRSELILPQFPADDLSITLVKVCIDNNHEI